MHRFCQALLAIVSSVFSKRRVIHQMPASATAVYIILATIVVAPPQIQATASKENNPTRPQFSAPIIATVRAILFIIFIFSVLCFISAEQQRLDLVFSFSQKIFFTMKNRGLTRQILPSTSQVPFSRFLKRMTLKFLNERQPLFASVACNRQDRIEEK